MEISWRGMSREHDWSADDRATPRRMVAGLRSAGIVGEVDWISTGPDDQRVPAPAGGDPFAALLDGRAPPRESHRFEAGGERPHPWRMAMMIARPDPGSGRIRGVNNLALWLDAEPFRGRDGSDRLAAAFRETHGPADTEWGAIHPNLRRSELTDTTSGAYADPVTIAPMFAGVFWGNFLGPGHLEQFDPGALRALRTYEVEWSGDEGLWVRVSPDIAHATSPEVEAEMFRLTAEFRAALR